MNSFDIPESLKTALSKGRVVPFVGAGLSMSVNDKNGNPLFPSWGSLLEDAAEKLESEKKTLVANYVRSSVAIGELFKAAEKAKSELGNNAWNEFLRGSLLKKRSDCEESSLVGAKGAWSLGSKLIITTNYDRVLNWGCPEELQSDIVSWDIQAIHEQLSALEGELVSPTVWHLHGTIDNVNEVILTPDGYSKLYASEDNKSKYETALASLNSYLTSYTLVFIGFSFSDEVFSQQLKSVSALHQGSSRKHFALVKKSEVEKIRNLDLNVEFVEYDDHGDLPDLLKKLNECTVAIKEDLAEEDLAEQSGLSSGQYMMSDLYESALPSNEGREVYQDLIIQNPEYKNTQLFELGSKAVEFREEVFLDSDHPEKFSNKHLLVSGPTGCGKTAFMKSLIMNALSERGGACLYIAPTRELVYEFHRNITSILKLANIQGVTEDGIISSTGEVSNDDYRIHHGNFQVVCIVSEKINVLFDLTQESILKKLSLVIIDELHMISDDSRGGVVDCLLAKLFEEVNRREAKYEDLELQVVGITTESMTESLSPSFGKNIELNDDEIAINTEPVIFNVESRPVSVEHNVAILLPGLAGDFFTRKTVDFEHQSDRNINSKTDSEEFRQEVYRSIGLNCEEWMNKPSKMKSTDIALTNLILEQTEINSSIIIAIPSVIRLKNLAEQVARKKLESKDIVPDEAMDELNDLLSRSGVASTMRELIKRLASSGIFLHYAGLPMDLKSWVVSLFSSVRAKGSGCLVLFTTETLTYGVNLNADCVILGDMNWIRSDVKDLTKSEKKRIDPNNFHNILGRAGRSEFYKKGIKPKAIVCIDAKDFSSAAKRKGFINAYYNTPGYLPNRPRPPVSGLFDGSVVKECSNPASSMKLEDFSFPTFRSIMDALRHVGAGGSVTVDSLVNFFSYTVYWRTNPKKHKQLRHVVEKFLEAASGHSVQDSRLKLIVKNQRTADSIPSYQIQPQGEALIDTGTRLQTIEPLAGWLSMIHNRADSLRVDGDVPVELLIPGFVVSPDFWIIAKGLVVEGNPNYSQPLPEALQKAEKYAKNLLIDELKALRMDEESIDNYLEIIIAYSESWLGDLSGVIADCKCNVLLKLTSIVLMWIRGADLDEIAKSYKTGGEGYQKAPEFQAKYADKLGWLSTMAHRFFKGKGGYLLPEHERDLPLQSLRLRLGVPVQGLPFLGKSSVDSVVSRYQIKLLLDNNTLPSSMLWFKTKDVNSLVPSVEGLKPLHRKMKLLKSVRAYFKSQIDEFGSNMFFHVTTGDESQAEWSAYSKKLIALTLTPDKDESITRRQKEFSDMGQRLVFKTLSEYKDEGQVKYEVTEQSNDSLLVLGKSGNYFTFKFLLISDDIVNKKSTNTINVLSLWPWPEATSGKSYFSDDDFFVTSFGAIVISVLLVRNFIDVEDVVEVLSRGELRSKHIISIKKLLSELNFIDIERSLIREFLLRFFEPGSEVYGVK